MVTLILGNKGSGKTKRLIALCNQATDESKGNVVFIEKEGILIYDVSHRARLVVVDEYGIKGFNDLYGFISGMCAGNYDITDFFVDSTLKIGGSDFGELAAFVERLAQLGEKCGAKIYLSVSADQSELPESIVKYAVE